MDWPLFPYRRRSQCVSRGQRRPYELRVEYDLQLPRRNGGVERHFISEHAGDGRSLRSDTSQRSVSILLERLEQYRHQEFSFSSERGPWWEAVEVLLGGRRAASSGRPGEDFC